MTSPESAPLDVVDEVRDALAAGRPVAALETTIISHGFPYPENLALAARLEAIRRRTAGRSVEANRALVLNNARAAARLAAALGADRSVARSAQAD